MIKSWLITAPTAAVLDWGPTVPLVDELSAPIVDVQLTKATVQYHGYDVLKVFL